MYIWRLTICPCTVIGLNCLGTGFTWVCVCVHRGVCIYAGGGAFQTLKSSAKVQSWIRKCVCALTFGQPFLKENSGLIQVRLF